MPLPLLAIAAAAMLTAAASTGFSLRESRSQEKLELASLEAETEAAKLEATDEALTRTKSFRHALASQLALASLRSGAGGSLHNLIWQF